MNDTKRGATATCARDPPAARAQNNRAPYRPVRASTIRKKSLARGFLEENGRKQKMPPRPHGRRAPAIPDRGVEVFTSFTPRSSYREKERARASFGREAVAAILIGCDADAAAQKNQRDA